MKPLHHFALAALLLLTASITQAKTLDLMVLYTPQATQTWEGRDIQARIQSFVEYFNHTLQNSGTDMDVRLVHIQRMDWAGDLNRATGYNLNRLAGDARVNALRNQYGADIVSLVYRNPPRESCGIGRIATGKYGRFYNFAASGGDGYNLSAVNCYIHIIAHESGHNMGLRHSPVQDRQAGYDFNYRHSGTFPYSRGYGVNGRFITPMAYPNAYGTWNVQPFYSNPRRTCEGQPCGVVDYADAAWALKMMADQITGYRPTRVNTTPTQPQATVYDFEQGVSGWNGFYSAVDRITDVNGRAVLRAYNRNQSYSGTVGNLSGVIEGGKRYRIEGDIWIKNRTQNRLRSWLYVEDNNGQYRWLRVTDTRVSGYEWHRFGGEIEVDMTNVRRALLYVYGPQANSNFIINKVSVQPL
ncbi:M57 family metalloprotease [Marinobacteraceae bacterium S3BR75-40.1]